MLEMSSDKPFSGKNDCDLKRLNGKKSKVELIATQLFQPSLNAVKADVMFIRII